MTARPSYDRAGEVRLVGTSPKAGRFFAPALDGVRALAFAVVFASHVPGMRVFPGGFGVTVFFFLSGYLITTLLRLEFAATAAVDFRNFYLRRFLRILPPYFLTLLLLLGLLSAGAFPGAAVEGETVLAQALFLANYWLVARGPEGMIPGSEVLWSLAVEEHFYLGFPAVALVLLRMRRPRAAGAILLAACGGVLAWRVLLFTVLDPGDAFRLTYATDTRIDSILFGCAVALGLNPVVDPRGRAMTALAHPVTAALAGVGIVATLLPRDPAFRETLRYTLQGLLLVPLYLHLLAHPEGPGARILSHPWLRRIGVLSYTLYLVHYSLMYAVDGWFPAWPVGVVAAVTFGLSVGYAEAVNRAVEQPLARLRAALR